MVSDIFTLHSFILSAGNTDVINLSREKESLIGTGRITGADMPLRDSDL